ncbi:hypothetical protein EYV94_24350 [Puteibacter caeruleilacunae]|nr:hypothetical protein EYV94_24350 [Puteibacter caeruleilacunae]
MKKEQLLDKYYSGEIETPEFEILREEMSSTPPKDADELLFNAINQHRHLQGGINEQELITSIETIQFREKRHKRIRLLRYAASLLVLLTVGTLIFNPGSKNQLSTDEQFDIIASSLLQVSQEMELPEPAPQILYEDDNIVIYVE